MLYVLSSRWDVSLARTGAMTDIPAKVTLTLVRQGASEKIWQPRDWAVLSAQRLPVFVAKASLWRLNAKALTRVLQAVPLEGNGQLES